MTKEMQAKSWLGQRHQKFKNENFLSQLGLSPFFHCLFLLFCKCVDIILLFLATQVHIIFIVEEGTFFILLFYTERIIK